MNARTIQPRRLLACLLAALQTVPLQTWAATALVADPAAAVRPVLNVSGNGVPIVQIVPPNAAGVSHNKFIQYNVGAEGQILNNSGQGSGSVLAGSVGGNPLLGNGNARLILNEVTSANPSALNGLIEITGKRADLVIANPNGISVDGAGFINASRATLTTGLPQLGAGGDLAGFDIRQGRIDVLGAGLDARDTDQLQLLSRSLVVNANLQANALDIVAGANRIDVETGAIAPQAGTGVAPTVAVDVGALGGMYAGSIYLVGTEAGVGVNSRGKLEALVGDIQLSSAGDLGVVDGGVKAVWDVRIDAARDIRIQGSDIQAGGDVEIVAGRNLDVVATDNSTAGTSVAGNTTTTTAATKWTGSVIEAGGDATLVANNNPEYTPDAEIYAAWQSDLVTTEQRLAVDSAAAGALKSDADLAVSQINASNFALLSDFLDESWSVGVSWSGTDWLNTHTLYSGWGSLHIERYLPLVSAVIERQQASYSYDISQSIRVYRGNGEYQDSIWMDDGGWQLFLNQLAAEQHRIAPLQAKINSYATAEAKRIETQSRLDVLRDRKSEFDGGKLTLSASAVRAEGNALLAASNVSVESKVDSELVRSVYYKKKKKLFKKKTTTTITETLEESLVGGAVSSAGDATILALGNRDSEGARIDETGNLLLLGASIASDLGAAQLTAANDLEVEAAQTRHDNSSETFVKKSGILSTTKTTNIDRSQNTLAEGSLVTGDSVQLQSGRDLMVRGGIVSANNDVSLVAGRDIDIVEARDFESRDSIRIKKKSGLFGSGLFGITLGSTSTTQISEEDLDTASASQIASIAGGISILGGNDVLIQGADLLAGTDIDIVGNNVGILAARNVYDRRDIYKTRTSGLTLALKGGVISALEAAWQAAQRADGAQDDRLEAAYTLKAGYHFYDAILKDSGAGLGNLLQGNFFNNESESFLATNGVNLELSLGASSSESVNTQHDVTYRASNLDAAGDLTVIARAPEAVETNPAQTGGVLDIMGSNLAGYNQTLSAGKLLSVRYAPQTSVSTEKSSNQSASIGVGIGTNGLYYTAALQIGKATGQALKEDNGESRLVADNTLTLLSGGDATLKGAIATANRIEADIEGNLALTSLQDSERYKYKSSSAGGSVTVGIGVIGGSLSLSQQTINNQFQSVVEQTGLFAGDGGFDIDVGGHTQLNGAALASAATPDKNRLSTNTLDYTDLVNFEQTKTGGYTFGLSTAPGGTFATPVPNLSVDRKSVTQSLVAPGTVEVRGAQAELTTRVVDYLNLYKQVQSLTTQLATLAAQKDAIENGTISNLVGLTIAQMRDLVVAQPNSAAIYQNIINLAISQQLSPDQQAIFTQYSQTQTQLAAAQAEQTAGLDGLIKLNTRVPTLQTRTLETANPALANSFNKERTRAQLEAMNVFSETAMRIVGDVYEKYDKAVSEAELAARRAQQQGDAAAIAAADARLNEAQAARNGKTTERALAHGLVGALTAAIGGTSPTSGFVGGAAGKLVSVELDELLAGSDWAQTNPTAANLLKTLSATTAGSLVGGTTGGFVASNGDRFNRQLHAKHEVPLLKKRAKELAQAYVASLPPGTNIDQAEVLRNAEQYWFDLLFQAGSAIVDARENREFAQYLANLETAVSTPGTEGNFAQANGDLARYYNDLRTAQAEVEQLAGQLIAGETDSQGNAVYSFSATRPQYLDNELFKGKGTTAYEELMLANLRLDKHRDNALGYYSTRNGAATPDTTLEELLLLGNAKLARGTTTLVLGAANRLTGGRATSKVLGLVDDFDGNAIPLYSASGKYAFEKSGNITVTGANLEALSKQFIQDTHGKDFIGFFETKIGGNQGLDIGYAAMVNGKPQLFIVEAKAGDSALTALGENKVETLNRNLGVLKTSIENSLPPDGELSKTLLSQIQGRNYKLELHVGPDNAAKTAARIDSTLTDKLNTNVSRIVQFNRK